MKENLSRQFIEAKFEFARGLAIFLLYLVFYKYATADLPINIFTILRQADIII